MPTELHKAYPPYKPKGKEDYMNPRQLGHFRKMLEEMKRELSQDIDRTVHTMQDEATIFADPNDRASQESDMSLELRNRDRERKLKRLEARPTATLCIDCKTLDEMREKQVAK
jgi:DnaK suppressor protein